MAITSAWIVAAMLTLGPPTSEVSNAAAIDEYRNAVAALEAAMLQINGEPEQGSVALRAALEQLQDFAPLLAEDPQALELRTMGELALARAELAGGDRYAASATIDATLEALGDRPLDLERLGPSLAALVRERAAAIDARGSARLRVQCSIACRVLVDERNVGDVSEPGLARELSLTLGKHRVWVETLDPSQAEPLRTTVALDSAQQLITLDYPHASASEHAGERVPPPSLVHEGRGSSRGELPTRRARIAPRWAEITPLLVGSAAMLAGAVLWALDSKCPRGADPQDIVACPELYDTRNAGIALLSGGFAAGLAGGVMLVVDETRVGDRRSRELGLLWTTRF